MSSQKGNVSRTRAQKYKNKTAFQNDKYDKSSKMQAMKSMTHEGLCHRCTSIIEWKIQYKKYKPLSQPATCILCKDKTVKKAYHKVCQPCARKAKVCEKCNEKKEIAEKHGKSEEEKRLDEASARFELMHLPERKRRTVTRFMEKGGTLEEALTAFKLEDDDYLDDFFGDSDDNDNDSENPDDGNDIS